MNLMLFPFISPSILLAMKNQRTPSMANQPTPIRPWFRLASIRAPAPTPAPAAEPRPPVARPAFRALAPTSTQTQPPTVAPPTSARPATLPAVETPAAAPPPAPAVINLAPSVGTTGNAASVPSSPVARASAPSGSLPTSPVPRAVRSTNSVPTSPAPKPAQANGGANQPLKPMNGDETPPHSPTVKHSTARPPSPFTLPPSQLKPKDESEQPEIPGEPEPKIVLVQKTIEKPKSSYDGNAEFRNSREVRKSENFHDGKQEASKEVETKDGSTQRKVSGSENGGPRVIILAGENKGAVMDLSQSSSKKHGFGTIPNHLHEKGNPSIKSTGGRQWDTYSSSSNEDEHVKRKDKSHEGKTKASPLIAYMNSNVQGLNNSIMCHSKCHHKDPGIHLLSRNPFSEEFQLKERVPDYHD